MTRKTSIRALIEDSPWEIAEALGIGYTGDMNPFNHGGLFYSKANWESYGYADCVLIEHYDGKVHVQCGTINKPSDLEACFRSAGWARYIGDCSKLVQGTDVIDITPEVEIESAYGHWGMDPCFDYSGQIGFSMKEDCNERTFWKHAIGWINGLATDE